MIRPSILQQSLHHALRNARWYLLLSLVCGWYAALGLRLSFLRVQGSNHEESIALRAHADRKSLPLRIQGNGAYFRLVPPPAGPDQRGWRLQPLGVEVRVDGAAVPRSGIELDAGAFVRHITVDGLALRYEFKRGTPVLAQEGWELSGRCVSIGKSLSAEVSLDSVGMPPLAARLCRELASIENLSASQPLHVDGEPLAPGRKTAWNLGKLVSLGIGPASHSVELRVSLSASGGIAVALAEEDQRSHLVERATIVGNMQMQFTRVLPRSKSDYQLLEQLQEALDKKLLNFAGSAPAAQGLPVLPRLVAAAITPAEQATAAVLLDGRVRRLLSESRRVLELGQAENSHVYVGDAAGSEQILDIRDRAVRVVAQKEGGIAQPLKLEASAGQSPSLEILAGRSQRTRILTDAPVAGGHFDLLDLGADEPEAFAAPAELRRPPPDEPGGAVVAGRTVVLSSSGVASIHPELPPDLDAANRAFAIVRAGDTLDSIVRRLAATPDGRGPLKARLLSANPGLEPRRLKPGQRLLVPATPEVNPKALRASRAGAWPHVQFERRGQQSYLKVLAGPASLGGEPLPAGAVVPLRSGDRITLGAVPMLFRDPRGVLRERKLSQGRVKDAYPMGSDAVLLAGFEDRLAPLARLATGGTQKLSVDADLQHLATTVLREHLAYLDRLAGRAYTQAGKVHAGSISVLDWKTGAVLAAASLPAFEPGEPGAYQLASRRLAPSSPFLDRSFASLRPAGSTFKLVVLAAYLEQLEKQGRLPQAGEPVGPVFCCGDGVTANSGSIYLDGRQLRCHRADRGGHGVVRGVANALEVSCNVYFAKLALQLGGLRWDEPSVSSGPQILAPRGQLVAQHPLFDVASRLGLDFDYRGQTPADRQLVGGLRQPSAATGHFVPLGISPLAAPRAGVLPAPLHFYRDLAKKPDLATLGLEGTGAAVRLEYKPLRHLAYLAIGQDMTISTYHLALIAAAIAADGMMPRAWVTEGSGPAEAHRVFSAAVARRLREAMALVTGPSGTAPVLRDQARGGRFPFTVFAKTGTAQLASSERGAPEARRADSLLVSFVDDPRLPPLAVAFRVENGDATRDPDGIPLPTPAKHLAARFYSAVLDLHGLWPDRALPPPAAPPEEPAPPDEPESVLPDEAAVVPETAARSPRPAVLSSSELTRQLNRRNLRAGTRALSAH